MKILLSLLIVFISLNAKDYKIGFAQDTLANDWRLSQVNEVKKEVKKYPHLSLTVKDAKASVANQIADIEYFIDNNYDFIITSPIDAVITSLVLKKAIDKGIKVILISRGIIGKYYTVFIAPKNRSIAIQAANYMADKLDGSGTILMLEGIKGATTTKHRREGFEYVMKNYPKINIITKRANFLRADAINVMQDIYKDDIKFDAIYSHSDSMLSGVRSVMKKENKDMSIIMVGIDYITEAKHAILDKKQSASFTYPTCGKEGVQAIVDIISGKEIKKDQVIDSEIITQDNADKIKAIF